MSDEQITLPKPLLQAIFDIATGSMDFGSGFLGDEEQEALVALADAIGVDPMSGVQANFRCKYRAKAAGQKAPIHNLTDWYLDTWRTAPLEVRYCRDCNGGREERQAPPPDPLANPTILGTGFQR